MTIDIAHKEKEKKYEEDDLTFFEKLSRDISISNFKIVVFVGSEDDKYVPGYSSVLQYEG